MPDDIGIGRRKLRRIDDVRLKRVGTCVVPLARPAALFAQVEAGAELAVSIGFRDARSNQTVRAGHVNAELLIFYPRRHPARYRDINSKFCTVASVGSIRSEL